MSQPQPAHPTSTITTPPAPGKIWFMEAWSTVSDAAQGTPSVQGNILSFS